MWFGVWGIAVPFAFIACGDGSEGDGGGSNGGTGGEGGEGASTGGTPTGGKGGTVGTGGSRGGASGASGRSTGGDAGAGMGGEGGEGGEAGGMAGDGGEAGTAQGGTAGGGAGGAMAGGGAGGAMAGGGAGGAMAGGGAGGAIAGTGGVTAGGGAGGAAGTAGGGTGGAAGTAGGGTGGTAGFPTTCDPVPAPRIFVGELSGAQEDPTNTSTGVGLAIAELSPGETQLTVSVYWSDLTTNTTIGHIHGPAPAGMNAGVQFDLAPPAGATSGEVVGKPFAISATQVADLEDGLYYANIHSTMFPNGELRAQLMPGAVLRTGTLSGLQVLTPNDSTATGRVVVAVFPSQLDAVVSMSWSGLGSNATTVRLHGPAGIGFVTGPVLVLDPPTGATSGSITHEIWTFGGFDVANLILNNDTYAQIGTVDLGYGEIRAQLLPPCP